MTERRWREGMRLSTGDGLDWHVVVGSKRPGDLVLMVRGTRGWQKVRMETGFLMADFLTENEDILKAAGYFSSTAEGGGYYLKHLMIAASEGWQAATEKLEAERQARRLRELGPSISTAPHTCDWQEMPPGSNQYRCVICGVIYGTAA